MRAWRGTFDDWTRLDRSVPLHKVSGKVLTLCAVLVQLPPASATKCVEEIASRNVRGVALVRARTQPRARTWRGGRFAQLATRPRGWSRTSSKAASNSRRSCLGAGQAGWCLGSSSSDRASRAGRHAWAARNSRRPSSSNRVACSALGDAGVRPTEQPSIPDGRS